ncbi:MAG: hypothetical protein DRP87_03405 [Spirochaetes bacterium]|nr:MAG: hypothetical protein DRP87_03405 [Spirochaetota bacterium]
MLRKKADGLKPVHPPVFRPVDHHHWWWPSFGVKIRNAAKIVLPKRKPLSREPPYTRLRGHSTGS